MKEKVIAAYVFVKAWRFVAWTILVLTCVAAVPAMVYEMTRSSCTFINAWQEYKKNVAEREEAHIAIALQNLENSKKAVQDFMASYQFSLEQIKEANPTAELPSACPFKTSLAVEQTQESAHILLHALSISAPAIALEGEEFQNEVMQQLGEQVAKNKEQMYAAIYASLAAVREPLLAEVERVNVEIGKKRAQQEELKQQIDTIRFPMVRKEEDNYIPRDTVYLPEKSVYQTQQSYPVLHGYGVELPMMATYPKDSQVLEHKRVQDWKESISRLAAWLPMVINREPLRETVMKESKDMNHVLSEEDRDRIKTLGARIDQIEKEIEDMMKKLMPVVAQLENMAKAEDSLQQHKGDVLSGWQVDADYAALKAVAAAAANEKVNYESDMRSYEIELRIKLRAEIDRTLDISSKEFAWNWETIKDWLNMVRIGLAMVKAWLIWFLLLVVGDFLVCPLVCALRAQGLESSFSKEKKD